MGGIFTNKSATDLSVIASTAAMQAADLKPEKIDSVIFGHVMTVIIFIYNKICNSYINYNFYKLIF
jgi:acetyl-CoA acetyltransferase